MRPPLVLLAFVVSLPVRLGAQQLELAAPRFIGTESSAAGGWCFGVKLGAGDQCASFGIVELGVRARLTGQTDHSTRDPSHAYPVLAGHGFIAAGLARRIGGRSALGAVAELGGGDARQGLGVRYDRQLAEHARLDLTVGGMRVETHQRGVTRRRNANGTFADAALRANDLFVLQARVERFPGDGAIIKPARAAYLGVRVDGGGAVKTTLAALAILALHDIIVFFCGGKGS